MLETLSRRAFLFAAALSAGSYLRSGRSSADVRKTRLILLGTGGGPRPKVNSASSSQVIVIGDDLHVIDCGDGVARQLVLAGLRLPRLRHVYITHHHSDHNADYGNLLLLSWAAGLGTPVDTWGPPPLARMTRLYLEANEYDIRTRMEDEGRLALEPLIRPHEVERAGIVHEDANVRVTCALVSHPPVTPSLAYRFDTADRSIVISGDTARSDALIELARGADVLVHEAMFLPAIDRLVATVPNASTLRQHLVDSHTTVEDCGRVAAAAGVKTLVLSHLVPPDDPQITEAMWLEPARAHFSGTVILGRDLLEI